MVAVRGTYTGNTNAVLGPNDGANEGVGSYSNMTAHDYAYTRTNDVLIRTLEDRDTSALYKISNNPATKHLWIPNAEQQTQEEFALKLRRRIAHRWQHFYVIERRRDQCVLGFAYCYNGSVSNAIASLCICIDLPYINSFICLRALYLYLSHLFVDQGYRKLYAEVYAYNERCVNFLDNLGFAKEACLTEHQLWRKKYWSQYIYSISLAQYKKLCEVKTKLIERLSCKQQKN